MPKKTRKMKQRAAMRRSPGAGAPLQDELEQIEDAAVEETPAVARPTLSAAPRPTLSASRSVSTPMTYDYTHIYNDLKRIALFAGFFFVVLIVLSFVIK